MAQRNSEHRWEPQDNPILVSLQIQNEKFCVIDHQGLGIIILSPLPS